MFVIKKMQINKLQAKPIVSNRSLFLSMGARPCTVESKESAECVNEPTPYGARKTQLLALGAKIAENAATKQATDGKAPSINVKPQDL